MGEVGGIEIGFGGLIQTASGNLGKVLLKRSGRAMNAASSVAARFALSAVARP